MGHYHGRSKPFHRQGRPPARWGKGEPLETKIVGGLIFGIGKLLALPFKRKSQKQRFIKSLEINKTQVKMKFLEIERLVKLGSPSNFQKALVEADKLLDFVLKSYGYEGETFADRLRSAKNDISNYEDLWSAHKLRNQAVHEFDQEILSHQVVRAVGIYKKALNDLKIL